MATALIEGLKAHGLHYADHRTWKALVDAGVTRHGVGGIFSDDMTAKQVEDQVRLFRDRLVADNQTHFILYDTQVPDVKNKPGVVYVHVMSCNAHKMKAHL